MKLVIGGFAQGKLEYVIRDRREDYCVIDEKMFSPSPDPLYMKTLPAPAEDKAAVIVNHLHLIIKACKEKDLVRDWIFRMAETCAERGQELVVISDEVGSGVIPVDADERQFREDTGRILCDLAREADCVERIICGLPQILK